MLRAMYGFDHLPKTPAPVLNGAMTAFAPYLGYGATLLNTAGLGIDPDGFLGGYSVAALGMVAFDVSGLGLVNPTKVTFGFRLKTLAAYAGGHVMFSLATAANPTDATAYSFTANGGEPAWIPAVGQEIYVELTYDFVAFTCTALVNGIAKTLTAGAVPSAAIKASFVTGNWAFNFVLGHNTLGYRYAIRDVYVIDAVVGDGMVGPIGPQRMFPIQLDAADGTNWTPSAGGTVLDTLNAAYPAAATVTSAADKTPLITSLKNTTPEGVKINGVHLFLSGQSLGDGSSINKCEVSQGGTTLAPKFVTVARVATYTASVGLFTKAPDGGAWSIAKLDATAVKLTPDTSA